MHVEGMRWRALAAPLLLAIIGIACGDVYRPVAQPIIGPQPSPAALTNIFSLATDGTTPAAPASAGSISRIDVSGDSVSSIVPTGVSPVHAAITPDGTKIYAANLMENTVSESSTSSTGPVTTIDLAQLCSSCNASPIFVHTTENGRIYVADAGDGTVSVINAFSDVLIATVAVDPAFSANSPANPLPSANPNARPVALAETPNGTKIYSVNQGNSTVTSINTQDDSIASVIHMASPPIWAVASGDSAYIYVLDTGGTISVISTVSDTVVSSLAVGAGSNFIFYDGTFNRLYVTNPTLATLSILDVSGNTLVAHGSGPVAIAPAAASACSAAAVQAGQAIPPVLPVSVDVLPDGSRAYVAGYQVFSTGGSTSVCTQATVVDSSSSTVSSIIPLQQATDDSAQTGCSSARFRVFAVTGGTSSRYKVYVSQCDAGSISVIDTYAVSTGTNQHGADVVISTISAPVSSFPGQPLPPPQNPIFLVSKPQ